MEEVVLASVVVDSLLTQGFTVQGGRLLPPESTNKELLRSLHSAAVDHRRERARPGLEKHESELLGSLARGDEVDPTMVSPRLVEVLPGSYEELLFRYASLHWSIPVSSGYGRRLRFLVVDGHNSKLMGLFGLGDPVFSLAARDNWIGWGKADRAKRLRHMMDAFVLGSVPPYSMLLCGKLVAMLVASHEVRESFRKKYEGRESLIGQRSFDGNLALITTTSALGRSSLYNRVKFRDRPLYYSVGFTKGSGEFHFSNGLYDLLSEYSASHCAPTAKHARWGTGFRNRREIVKKALPRLGLSADWLFHGIQREIFVVPLAENAPAFLRGEDLDLGWFHSPAAELFAFFRERWLLPRSQRDLSYRNWCPQQWALWTQ